MTGLIGGQHRSDPLEVSMDKPIDDSRRGSGASAEDGLRDVELRLREKELRLKEQELDAKAAEISANRRHVWLGSPMMMAAASAIFGLVGTGFGAVLQGFSNTALERQKFEAGLIQKALETPDKNEAAKNLLFLVGVGLISQFDTQKIAMMARDPQKLPTIFSDGTVDSSDRKYSVGSLPGAPGR
jgi:hypothetical protein